MKTILLCSVLMVMLGVLGMALVDDTVWPTMLPVEPQPWQVPGWTDSS